MPYNALVFWPTDLLLAYAGVRWLARGRRDVGRLVRRYAYLRVAALAQLALAQLVGLSATQDIWVYLLAAALVFGAVAAAVKRPPPRSGL